MTSRKTTVMTAGPVAYSSNSFTTNAPPWKGVEERRERRLVTGQGHCGEEV